MLSPITPPPTPILEGAGHLVVDCEPILAVNTPPQSPVLQTADRESCILVTKKVEVIHEAAAAHEVGVKYEAKVTHKAEQRTLLDISQLFHTRPSNNPWKLFYVRTDEIEADDSDWGKIASTPGIYVLGKRLDGYYEVIVDESCIPWLLDHNFLFLDKAEFEFLFGYDPTQPTKIEVDVYGVWGARRRSCARFLENSFKAIWSRRSKGLKLCLRSITPPYLETALEWAILSNDILESSAPVREKFTLCLVLLALSLLEDYNAPSAIHLLEKNQDGVLQAFRKDSTDLFKATSAKCQNRKAEAQLIGLVRRVFIFAGGLEDVHQLKFDNECTAIDNLNKLGSLVSITSSICFRNFDLQAILSALYKSKAITNKYIDTLDIAELISKLMTLLPIGFQSDLGLPTKVPKQLPLRYKLRAPSTIYPLRALGERNILGDGVYELRKRFSDRKLVNGDVVKLQLGSVVAGSTSQKLIEDTNVCPPSPLDYSFDEKIASDRTILEEKPKWMKRSVRQSIRERFTGPRVECSACGLGRIFSSICCKFLGNRGYVAL